MLRQQLILAFGLSLFLIGCGETAKSPAEFPSTPDAPGSGSRDVDAQEQTTPPTGAHSESPKNLAVPDVKPPKADEVPPAKDVEAAPKADAETVLLEDEVAEIRKLPDADQALAIHQVRCPISGEHLGSMGKPVARDVEGTKLFLCCKGCIEELEKDPKSAIAKLPKN